MCNYKKKSLEVKIVKNRPDAKIPTRGSEYAAGYDLSAAIDLDITINPGENSKIDTGLSFTAPAGYFGAIYARSGMAIKRGLRPGNCVGVIDEDYTGPVIVALYNDSDEPQIIHNGDRIAQLIFIPYPTIDFKEVDSLEKTERGAGGFGSSGSN